jgi:hypothetical protein
VSPRELRKAARERLWFTVEEAADALDMARSTAYAAIKAGAFPVPVIQVSRREFKVPIQPLLRLAGLDELGEEVRLKVVP